VGRKTETRSEKIARLARAEFEKGTALPAARRSIAKRLGEPKDGTTLLGTVDPVYFRLAGLANPLPETAAKSARSLAVAIRKRRDSGVRWETVAASAEATLGRRVSVAEAKGLYSKGGGDLESSYAGRGTRIAAPKTYAAPEVATEAATGK
jgi:hypothetical protein